MTIPQQVPPGIVTIGASEKVTIDDRSIIRNGAGGYGTITEAGNTSAGSGVFLGPDARSGTVLSARSVELRDRAHIHGDVTTRRSLIRGNGTIIDGSIHTGVPVPAVVRSWQVSFPSPMPPGLFISTTRDVAPGAYDSLVVQRPGKARLRPGTYTIGSLDLEPGATLELANASAGTVFLYVSRSIIYRGSLSVLPAGAPARMLLGYTGSSAVYLESPFGGVVVAPNAEVVLASLSGTGHRGAFFGRAVEVRPGTTVTQETLPFIADIGLPPAIVLESPNLRQGDTIERPASGFSTLPIAGRVESAFPIVSIGLTVNGTSVPVSGSAAHFTATAPLTGPGNSEFGENTLIVTARDANGAQSSLTFHVRLANTIVPGKLLVRFNPIANDDAVAGTIASIGGRITRVYRPTREYMFELPSATDTAALAASLASDRSLVAYALPARPGLHDAAFCSGTEDPLRDHPGQYYLGNNASYAQIDPGTDACRPGATPTDCRNPQDQCLRGVCYDSAIGATEGDASTAVTCSTDADCMAVIGATGLCSSGNRCVSSGGTLSTSPCTTSASCATGETCVPVGKCGKGGGANLDIGWKRAQAAICAVAGGTDEILVADAEHGGLANINHPDLRDRIWVNALECCGQATCPVVPGSLPTCTQGDVNGDGCPGRCGIDDDGDGFADLDDPDVKNLVQRLCGNGIDDDGDGTVDDCNLAAGSTGYPGEEQLAAQDDDEDGYIDDIHGYDFNRATWQGELYGSTHPARISAASHGTEVSSTMAATLDNGSLIAGIHPRMRIVAMTVNGTNFVQAMRYASMKKIEIVNMSWGEYTYCSQTPCTGTALSDYQSAIESLNRAYGDALDPSIVYVISSGNDRWDLSLDASPDASGACTSSRCQWRFPQNLGTYPDLAGHGPKQNVVIGASDMADEFADWWLGCNIAVNCRPGSNFSTPLSGGGTVVDFVAPGDSMTLLSGTSDATHTGGTSFSAPVVSAVAAMVASRFPQLRHRPDAIIDRLRSTLSPCSPARAGLRGCTGNMESPGRISLGNALDTVNYPLPAQPLWRNESWRLSDNRATRTNTHDVRFIDKEGDGTIDFMFEGSGGESGEDYVQRMFAYDAAAGTFREVTGAALPGIAGDNIQEAAVADFNGDGCVDMAWAGFLEPDPSPLDPQYPVRGRADRLLFQGKTGSTCTGVFADATSGHLPTQGDMTRDIDVIDANTDGHPDLYVTNARYLPGSPLIHGADMNDRLLVNTECSPGVWGCFVDDSAARLPGAPMADPHNSTTVCDVDQDGHLDIISANEVGANRLLINDGTGHFADESTTRGIADATIDRSHDVVCADWTGPGGVGGPDGYPEVLFGRRGQRPNVLLANNGATQPGHFTLTAGLLPVVNDTTSAVAACDLDSDGVPEIVFGNGDVNDMLSQSSRVLRFNGAQFVDSDVALGFNFTGPSGVAANVPEGGITEVVTCADLNHDGTTDLVAFGRCGSEKTWLFER